MSVPAYESGPWAAILLGLLFGLALEGAGFGSPRKLTAQFTLRDFAVLKVMFTAVVTAALGLTVLEMAGALAPGSYFIHTPYYLPFAIGGALIGAGFAIGGYCPGTSVVGLAGGRLDALAFVAGMVVGVWIFAGGFAWLAPLYEATQGPRAQRMSDLLGVPAWAIVAVLIVAAALLFRLAGPIERRFGGPLSAAEVVQPAKRRPGGESRVGRGGAAASAAGE